MKHVLLNRDFGEVQTVIVLGAGRGGTSVVAGCLRNLGVDMGKEAHPLKHEWSPIVYQSDDRVDLAATCRNIEMMNRDHELWGWKSPRDVFALEQIFPFLCAPGLIIVTRDLAEVANSAGKHQGIPFELGLYETAVVYRLIADRIRFWPWPILVVGFSEVLKNACSFVDLLCSFLNIESNQADKERAVSFIDPAGKAYRHFDAANRAGLDVIAQEDLELDAQIASSRYIEQYSQQYILGFNEMLEDTKRAAEILRGLSKPAAPRFLRGVIENIQKLLSRFSEDDLRALGLNWFSASPIPGNTALLETEYEEIFRKLCDGLAQAVRKTGQNIKASTVDAPEPYGDLSKLHRLLKILIRIRIELQKAL